MSDFYQEPPVLGNQYDEDRLLRAYLRWKLPAEVFTEIEPGLRRLGQRAVTDILALGNAAEASPPRHVPYDPWGRRIDHIATSDAWLQLERIAVEEGIVATAYERKHGPLSRLHQFALLYLYGPSSAIYTCPLAMTDGAARVLEQLGDSWLKSNPLPRLITRDPARFWTSGQWMTERTGGSDVGASCTVARKSDDGYRLYGTKWFTSATTAPMALTLGRVDGAPAGGAGLSLFYVELRNAEGRLQNILVHRLKDKLGTRALPTAELTLDGTPARLVGGEGHGIRKIAPLLNVTRAYNTCCAVSTMRRGLALARDYAQRRRAFGKLLAELPLHLETLAALQVEFAAAFHLTFRVAELMGREEVHEASADERALLRLLTPLAKLTTARQAIASCSEVLEAFGGAGYVEDTGLPRLLRDAQVLSIWEGTTNVLSLDVLRAIDREGAFEPLIADLLRKLETVRAVELQSAVERVRDAITRIEAHRRRIQVEGAEWTQAAARAFAFSLARTYTAGLMLEFANASHQRTDYRNSVTTALRWCEQELASLLQAGETHRADSQLLALDKEL